MDLIALVAAENDFVQRHWHTLLRALPNWGAELSSSAARLVFNLALALTLELLSYAWLVGDVG